MTVLKIQNDTPYNDPVKYTGESAFEIEGREDLALNGTQMKEGKAYKVNNGDIIGPYVSGT